MEKFIFSIERISAMKHIRTIKNGENTIEVKEVETNAELRFFIRFPDALYKGNKSYCPSLMLDEEANLRRDKNPAFEYCEARYFMAYKNGKPAGRVAAILNKRFNEVWDQKCMRFSRYDVTDDIEVSRALLSEVENWAAELGMENIQGPMGFCDLDHQGLLVDGFSERGMFITCYNHEYYMKHLEALGYTKHVDWVEREVKVPDELDPRIERIAEYSLKRDGLRVLEMKKTKEVLPYIPGVFDLLFDAYKHLYGVIPLSEKQIQLYKNQFISMVKPEFLLVVLDKNDKPVCFGVIMPSMLTAMQKSKGKIFPFGWVPLLHYFTAKKFDVLEMMLIGTAPEYMGKAVNANLITHMFRGAKKYGIKYAETGPMLESNYQIQSMWEKNFESRCHKRRRCYIKDIMNK